MPANGWMILVMGFAPVLQHNYATQMPGTATFWNRCGEATAEAGYFESFALKSGCVNAARKSAVVAQTA